MLKSISKFLKDKVLVLLIIAFLFILGRGIYLSGYDFLYGFSDNPRTVSVADNVSAARDEAGSQTYNSLSILIQLFSLTSIILVISQVKMMNDQSRMDMSYELYKENTEMRLLHDQARRQLQELESNCGHIRGFKGRAEFDLFYTDEKYQAIRRMAYHFEYIGYLVKNNKVHFNLIFDPITFPDWLIEESKSLREGARLFFPDFWEGTEYLYNEYQKARAASALKRARRSYSSSILERSGMHLPLFGMKQASDRMEKLHEKIDNELNKGDASPKKQKRILLLYAKYKMYAAYAKSREDLVSGDMIFMRKWEEIAAEFNPVGRNKPVSGSKPAGRIRENRRKKVV